MNWSNEWNAAILGGEIPVDLKLVINDGDFPTTVHAIQVGDLAVHEDLGKRTSSSWQVTHVPTLTRFNVLRGLHRKTDLIEWCKTVQAQLPDDWTSLRQLTTETYKSRSDAKDRIMNLCQGTPV